MTLLAPGKPQITSEGALPHRRSSELASVLRQMFAQHRPWFNELITLNGSQQNEALTLNEWGQPVQFASLFAAYSNHIYRNKPDRPRENKPLKSLWAQWYIGLLVPPVMLALLTHPRAMDISLSRIRAVFHETGRVASFCIDVQENPELSKFSPQARLETFWIQHIQPVISAIENSGDINGKLIWSNTGYLVAWFLTEMKPVLGEELVNQLRQTCFFEKKLLNGEDNPLFKTMLLRDGLLVRRTCCQRYRLPDVQQCGDCTLS